MTRVPDAHFDGRYTGTDDPWDLEHRWYEQRKRALTVAALDRPRYHSAFEPGCAAGLLTEQLAPRCDRLLAVDVAQRAVDAARIRLADVSHVTVTRLAVPDEWPAERFDLVVLSEIGYYLSVPALEQLRARLHDTLTDDGQVLCAHFRPGSDEHLLSGDEVHDVVGAGFHRRGSYVQHELRIDLFTRPGTR